MGRVVVAHLNVGNNTYERSKAASATVSASSAESTSSSESASQPVASRSRPSSPVAADHRGLPRPAATAEEVNDGKKR